MPSPGHETLDDAIRRIDAVLSPLINYGIDPRAPGLRQRLSALAAEMRVKHRAAEAIRAQADLLLPELLNLYINGSDQDRADLRALLSESPSFRWGVGWGLADRIATEADARNALAVFSVKDGGSDWRDQIVALDRLCAAIRRAGLPVAQLLTEAAAWSSDIPRFPPSRSTRALLIDYTQRFGD
jgi:hypothetical protein